MEYTDVTIETARGLLKCAWRDIERASDRILLGLQQRKLTLWLKIESPRPHHPHILSLLFTNFLILDIYVQQFRDGSMQR